MNTDPVVVIITLAAAALLPYLLASGSCFIKFSVVFSLLRNAIGLQQVPSNLTMNGLALVMSAFVMMPVAQQAQTYYVEHGVRLNDAASVQIFLDEGLAPYRDYLKRYSDPSLVRFFASMRDGKPRSDDDTAFDSRASRDRSEIDIENVSILTLLPAYALSELKSAFKIGFYIYLPFLVVDMVVSNVLLALGMMMMSPITFALPIKLILFVALDGWEKVVKGLVLQYMHLGS